MGQAPVILALAVLCAPRWAGSSEAPHSGVSVNFRDCPSKPVGRSVFFSALALELPPADHGPMELDVRLACDDIAEIRIRVAAVERARAVSFGDVPADQRARALALVVAELFRSAADEIGVIAREDAAAFGTLEASSAAVAEPASAKPEAANPPGAAAALDPSANVVDSGAASAPRATTAERGLRATAGASLRFVPHAASPLWGLDGGIERGLLRAQAEASWARSSVERGTITSGIGALRAGPRLEFSRVARVTVGGGASVGGGLTWAVGDSSVPGTTVEAVLKPYVDGRLELVTSVDVSAHFRPELMVFGGYASGIDAVPDGRVEQSTGGWFAGLRLGAGL